MRKILLVLLSLMCMTAVAQRRYTFIVQGGYQAFNIFKSENSIVKSGFRLGGSADYIFLVGQTVDLSIQAGLYYSSKGNKLTFRDKAFVEVKGEKVHYFNFPILFNTRFLINDKANIFVNGGFYGELGLGSDQHELLSDTHKLGKSEHSFKKGLDHDDDLFQNFDVGLQVGGGIKYNHVMLGLGLQYSTIRLFSLWDTPGILGIHATVGYRF